MMTFPEIFENFKNHSYIRRTSWSDEIFCQLKQNNFIRLIKFVKEKNSDVKSIKIIEHNYRLTNEDILGNDWVDIDEC